MHSSRASQTRLTSGVTLSPPQQTEKPTAPSKTTLSNWTPPFPPAVPLLGARRTGGRADDRGKGRFHPISRVFLDLLGRLVRVCRPWFLLLVTLRITRPLTFPPLW